MSRLKSGIWPILGLKLAILATFFEISTSNLFCPTFTIRLIGKPNKKSIGPKNFEPISAKFLAEMGSKFLESLNQKSETISFSGI